MTVLLKPQIVQTTNVLTKTMAVAPMVVCLMAAIEVTKLLPPNISHLVVRPFLKGNGNNAYEMLWLPLEYSLYHQQ